VLSFYLFEILSLLIIINLKIKQQMRKVTLILIIAIIGISSTSFAQRFGVKGGLNITNLKIENHDTSPKLGFHIGPITEIPFGDIFALETGVLISTKGNKLEETVFGITTKYKTNLVYLDIPINVKAGYDFGKTRVYGILGPYFAFGLTGKYKSKIDDGGDITKTDTKVEWGSDGSFKRFDSGLTIGACAAVSIFELGISYSHGFVNIATGDIHNTKNRVFSISAAYKFGKNPFKK